MFVLRRITSENLEINTSLGEDYVLVLKERNEEEFNKMVGSWSEADLSGIYGLVSFNGGESLMPLYERSHYYVMASDGKTFDNITHLG